MTGPCARPLSGLVGEVAKEAGIAPRRIGSRWSVVGNPIMHHLFLGIDPTQLGMRALRPRGRRRPRPAGAGARPRHARTPVPGSTSCPASPAMSAPTPPAWSWPRARISARRSLLLVDVGTNAEIVLGNRERLLACSSPTGPAFEGAQISAGQRAAPGAIERVRIDRTTLEPRFKVIGSRPLVGRARLRRGRRPRPASPASAARASSRSMAELFLAGSSRPTA